MDASTGTDEHKVKYPQTSPTWEYFENINRDLRTATCKLCGETLSYRGSVSNLKKHLGRRHNIIINKDDDQQNENNSGDELMEETYLEEEEEEETILEDGSRQDKRKSLRSEVWSYFDVADEEQRLATCQLCSEEYSYRTSSSNLAKHLKRCHSVDIRQVDDETDDKEERSYRKSGKTSIAWDYFTVKDPQRRIATCKLCDCERSYMSSVSNLMKHVRRKHGVDAIVATDDEQNDEDEKETSPRSPRHSNESSVWLYFKRLDRKNGIAFCLICKKKLSYLTSVTNLKRHLARKHPHLKLDVPSNGKTVLMASDGQLYEIEDDGTKVEILEDDDDQDAEPMQQIYLDELHENITEKRQKPMKKVKRIVVEDSNDDSSDEVTLKKRYVRKEDDSLDRFGKYLVSLLRQLPRDVSNRLQADFIKQTMSCENSETKQNVDDTLAVSSVTNDDIYVQNVVVENC